ncbi:mannonate dehydratase [Escherichia coli]
MQWMVDTVNSMANSFTMCTSSCSVRPGNDLVDRSAVHSVFTSPICAPPCVKITRKPSTKRRT